MVSAHNLRACSGGDTFRIPLAFVTLLQRFDAVISVSRVCSHHHWSQLDPLLASNGCFLEVTELQHNPADAFA